MPGPFADYQAVQTDRGSLALYAAHGDGPVVSPLLGPVEDPWRRGFELEHTLYAGARDGETWRSPAVRVHIGGTYAETLAARRIADGIDAYPSLRDKAGDLYDRLAASPLIKVDVDWTRDCYATLSEMIHAPAILHWVSYWPYRFDENYPDLLPPDPEVAAPRRWPY